MTDGQQRTEDSALTHGAGFKQVSNMSRTRRVSRLKAGAKALRWSSSLGAAFGSSSFSFVKHTEFLTFSSSSLSPSSFSVP